MHPSNTKLTIAVNIKYGGIVETNPQNFFETGRV